MTKNGGRPRRADGDLRRENKSLRAMLAEKRRELDEAYALLSDAISTLEGRGNVEKQKAERVQESARKSKEQAHGKAVAIEAELDEGDKKKDDDPPGPERGAARSSDQGEVQ